MFKTMVSAAMAAAMLSGCVTSRTEPASAAAAGVVLHDNAVRVEVRREGDLWTAEFSFDRDAAAWGFVRSALTDETRRSWRLEQWSVETPGVVLERVGDRDLLRSINGQTTPRTVRIRMKPTGDDLQADYGALIFSDGAIALPSGQFDVFPLTAWDEATTSQPVPSWRELGIQPAEVTWRDASGPILFKGERLTQVTAVDADTYVLFGKADQREGARLTTVFDPNLPQWAGDEIAAFAPRVADYYADRLGSGAFGRPTVMVSWNGPTENMASMSGSVMPALITISFEGRGIESPDAEILFRTRWFIAHEALHFWLGQQVRYEKQRHSWITEGGANLGAVRALKALNPEYDDLAELQTEVDDCVTLATSRAVETAGARGEQRAFYACGAVFAMVAEGAQRRTTGGDWLDFLRPLLVQSDGVLTRDEWLDALTEVSRDPSLRSDVERLLDEGAADPAAVIARLFERTGVGFRMEAGRVVLV